MSSPIIQFPSIGCVVEFLQGNEIELACVIELRKDKYRLLLPNRREMLLAPSRFLPWSGPQYSEVHSKDALAEKLEECIKIRTEKEQSINIIELWELAQGEMTIVSPIWLAELFETNPNNDTIAAYARALFHAKIYFRFQNSGFEIFNKETVAQRIEAEEKKRQQENFIRSGNIFFHALMDDSNTKSEPDVSSIVSDNSMILELKKLVFHKIANPESIENDAIWKQMVKGLSDDPYLPIKIAEAWGIIPPHYNFWLDRTQYCFTSEWENAFAGEIDEILENKENSLTNLPITEYPFISIDNENTKDIDDAFFIESTEDNGFNLHVALACPALFWNFGNNLDKAVLNRASSLYLPEGMASMMPKILAEGAFSLFMNESRPAFLVSIHINPDGSLREATYNIARVQVRQNLNYKQCEEALNGNAENNNPAFFYINLLKIAEEAVKRRKTYRISCGAVIMNRPDQEILLEGEGKDIHVSIRNLDNYPRVHMIIEEIMIAANVSMAEWASKNNIPLFFRTQDIQIPIEFSGEWHSETDISRISRTMAPAIIDTISRKHAGLGIPAYCTITSPIRRYIDLINQSQLISALQNQKPRLDKNQMEQLFLYLKDCVESTLQIQRHRIRYWKFVFLKQENTAHNNDYWFPAEITDLNELWGMVHLSETQLNFRAKRFYFPKDAVKGMNIQVRLSKITPLYCEAVITEIKLDNKSIPKKE